LALLRYLAWFGDVFQSEALVVNIFSSGMVTLLLGAVEELGNAFMEFGVGQSGGQIRIRIHVECLGRTSELKAGK